MIIDISDELYNYMCSEQPYDEHLDKRFDCDIRYSVKKGIPLPKGHGRLIDISPYEEYFNTEIYYDDGNHIHTKYTSSIPTIIEADKESK